MTRAHAHWLQIETLALLQFSAIIIAESSLGSAHRSVVRNCSTADEEYVGEIVSRPWSAWEPVLRKEVADIDRGNYGTGCGRPGLARIGSVQD